MKLGISLLDCCHMELVMMKSLECYCLHCFKRQTLKLETWELQIAGFTRLLLGYVFITLHGENFTFLMRLDQIILTWDTWEQLCSFEQAMMTGTARFTLTCGDWVTGLNHRCHHLLCGLELLFFSALNLKSLLNRKHTTRLPEKPTHCLDQMSRLNNREHNTTLRICLIGLGANTVYEPKVKSDKASETLIDNLSFRSTIRLLILELLYNKEPFWLLLMFKLVWRRLSLYLLKVDMPMALLNWRSSSTKLVEPSAYSNMTKSRHWKHWLLTPWKN